MTQGCVNGANARDERAACDGEVGGEAVHTPTIAARTPQHAHFA